MVEAPTDLKISEFTKVTAKKLAKWKSPIVEKGCKYYPPTGKHNLYRGAKIATYLLGFEDDEFAYDTNLEILSTSTDVLKKEIQKIEDGDFDKEIVLTAIKNIIAVVGGVENASKI